MSEADSRKAPLLKNVADNADVSTTTASMVFTNSGRISEKTRQKVLDTAARLGYQHRIRNTRQTKKSLRVGLLLSYDKEWTFAWHFLSVMVEHIDKNFRKQGLQVLLIPISHNEETEVIYEKIKKAACVGVISVHIGMEDLFRRLESQGIPTIIIMNNNYQDEFFSICVDDFQGAYEGTRHLLSLGHRSIRFIDGIRTDLPNLSIDRYFGFLKAVNKVDIQDVDNLRVICKMKTESQIFKETMQSLFAEEDAPTAFFCLDDEIALTTWTVCRELGFEVPKDVSLIAPGDVLDYSKPYFPCISTMHIDMDFVGRLAVEMMINRIENNVRNFHVLKVKQHLVDRGSCIGPNDSP